MEPLEFTEQKAVGLRGEAVIDSWLSFQGYEPELPSQEMELEGIDRILWRKRSDGIYAKTSAQYKTDNRASFTGNLFIETQIRERNGVITPGWLYGSVAQKIFWYLPQNDTIIEVYLSDLRDFIDSHGGLLLESQWVENVGRYAGKGKILPIALAEKLIYRWGEYKEASLWLQGLSS